MSSYKLLVVDDEKLAREYIINLIDWSRFGIDAVYEADNCFNALEIIEDKKPDIVFLDIKMPEMTGTELLMVLCEKNINTQVVVLSGYSDFESARMMLKTGKVITVSFKTCFRRSGSRGGCTVDREHRKEKAARRHERDAGSRRD